MLSEPTYNDIDNNYRLPLYDLTPSENIRNHKYDVDFVNSSWSTDTYWCQAQTEKAAIIEALNVMEKIEATGNWWDKIRSFKVYRVLNEYYRRVCVFEKREFDEEEYIEENF